MGWVINLKFNAMKLLNKSIGLYILYASVLLLIAMPVLYFSIHHRVVHEMDESLLEQKEKIINKLRQTDEANLLPWLQNSVSDVALTIVVNDFKKPDHFYTIISFDKISKEKSPYRIAESNIILNGKTYLLQIKSSMLDSQDLIESIVTIVIVLLFLIIAGLLLINQLLSIKLWKPFYNTIQKLHDFKIDKSETLHFEHSKIKEFNELNNAITALTSRNLEVYLSQKEFTENASHEMQTPLAVLQGKLDLLMQTNPLTLEQSELISDLANVNQRMNRMNKTLLLLTKIENNQFTETENVSVKPVLRKLVEQYQFQANKKNILIQFDVTHDIEITANKILIEIMLGNLLSNAIKHTIENGHVLINGNFNKLNFINTANTGALNSDKIFERFQKQTADSNSIGLGLQIAKKIVSHFHYTINYSFQNQQHIFSLSF